MLQEIIATLVLLAPELLACVKQYFRYRFPTYATTEFEVVINTKWGEIKVYFSRSNGDVSRKRICSSKDFTSSGDDNIDPYEKESA